MYSSKLLDYLSGQGIDRYLKSDNLFSDSFKVSGQIFSPVWKRAFLVYIIDLESPNYKLVI